MAAASELKGVNEIDGAGFKLNGVGEIRGEDNIGANDEIAPFQQKILIRGEITIEKQGVEGGGLQAPDPVVIGGATSPYISLQQILRDLQYQIDSLTAQVAELQGKLGVG